MKNITVRQYSQLQNTVEYDTILEHLNAKNYFNGKEMAVNAMPYANVKYCIRLLPSANNWETVEFLFSQCFVDADFWGANVLDFFAAKKFMVSQFEQVVMKESKLLNVLDTDSHLWEMAGADRLKTFSDTLPLVQLGKLFGMYPFEIGRKPYGEVFNLLVQIKEQNQVEKAYQQLKQE